MWTPDVRRYTLKTGYTIYVCVNYYVDCDDEYERVYILNSKVNGKQYKPTREIHYRKNKGEYFRFLHEEIFISEMVSMDKFRFDFDLYLDKEEITVDYLKALLLVEKYDLIHSNVPSELMLIYPILTKEGFEDGNYKNKCFKSRYRKEVCFEDYIDEIESGKRIYLPCRLDIKDYFYLKDPDFFPSRININYNRLVPVISNSSIVDNEKIELETIVKFIKEGHIKILDVMVRR